MENKSKQQTHRDLLGGPRVQVHAADLADVHAKVAVDAGAADAEEHAEVNRCPARA
jgi:hypothetical protein